jgi:release factor glutamine methyltransferase
MNRPEKTQTRPRESQWNILKLLRWATSYFKSHKIENPRADAEILLAHALNLKRIDLYLHYDQPLCNHELLRFKTFVKRRIDREPVAYIIGVKEFWSMELAVTRDVLIPRPETECLVEAALTYLPENAGRWPKCILDLGTGSGAVVLALASQRPAHLFFASDCSVNAIRTARLNALRHHLDAAIGFFVGEWFSPLLPDACSFDMILSNPPYIPSAVIRLLQPEIHEYEPIEALDGGKDGLCCIRRIICHAGRYLNPGGLLLLEIGHDQKDGVRKIIDQCGNFEAMAFTRDYSGYDRVVHMRKRYE